jgi:hypothetical protein
VKYSGADWIKYYRPFTSEFGCKVADILGQVYRGIYHLDKAVLHKRIDWSAKHFIEITIDGELATFDNSALTELVLLCHEQSVRLAISGAAPGYLRLKFSPRKPDPELATWERHPSVEQAIATHQKHFSLQPELLMSGGLTQ